MPPKKPHAGAQSARKSFKLHAIGRCQRRVIRINFIRADQVKARPEPSWAYVSSEICKPVAPACPVRRSVTGSGARLGPIRLSGFARARPPVRGAARPPSVGSLDGHSIYRRPIEIGKLQERPTETKLTQALALVQVALRRLHATSTSGAPLFNNKSTRPARTNLESVLNRILFVEPSAAGLLATVLSQVCPPTKRGYSFPIWLRDGLSASASRDKLVIAASWSCGRLLDRSWGRPVHQLTGPTWQARRNKYAPLVPSIFAAAPDGRLAAFPHAPVTLMAAANFRPARLYFTYIARLAALCHRPRSDGKSLTRFLAPTEELSGAVTSAPTETRALP